MKRNSLSIRAVTAIGALCGAIMIPSISHAAGAVSVNSAPVCPSSATMSLTPAGDFNITCTAIGPPSCSVSPGSSTIGTGQSVTLTANCNPAATSYAWTGGGPTMSGQSAPLTFPTPGTFTYSVTGINGSGTGAASAAATVVVQAASVAPVCSVSATPGSISAGGTSTVAAICNPSATTYTWTLGGGGPAMSGASAVLTFPAAGTFSYSVAGTNSVGLGATSAAASVVVAPVGSCVPKAVAGGFTANGIRNLAIDRGASVTYSMPIYPVAGRTIEILSIQSTSSQPDLTSEFSVSTCPGDFDNMQADCKTWGTVNQSGTQLFATTNATRVSGTCTLILGTQYYINVRNTRYDRVTPACTPQTCYMILQLNSY